jgi:hypothetical protein
MAAASIAAPAFGYVILATSAIALQVVIHGFRFPGAARGAVFGKTFHVSQKGSPAYEALLEAHKKATGEDRLPQGGYPDMGTGRFAALLPYDQWLAFANAQRAHYNYVEGAATAVFLSLASGLYFPRASAALGLAYVLGREAFAVGYTRYGPEKRVVGAATLDLALLGMAGLAITGGLRQVRLA